MDADIMELEILYFLKILDELDYRISQLEKSHQKINNSNCAPYFEERLNRLESVIRKIVKFIKSQNQKE